ncbi:hypothetical protein GOODEAATRI_021191 [Goodea atripinnis]|uniref:Uncharacterized protein n=1 Tax=Goodea atripinnis TaxID=208336 RepID=A0ABV0PZZ4_9TELE
MRSTRCYLVTLFHQVLSQFWFLNSPTIPDSDRSGLQAYPPLYQQAWCAEPGAVRSRYCSEVKQIQLKNLQTYSGFSECSLRWLRSLRKELVTVCFWFTVVGFIIINRHHE